MPNVYPTAQPEVCKSLTTHMTTLTISAGHKKSPLARGGRVGRGYSPGSRAAFIIPMIYCLTASCLSTPSGRPFVSNSHSSAVNATSCAIHPGSEGGAIIRSIASCILWGIGLCTFPSHPSTVRGLICSILANSERDLPSLISHACILSFSIRAYCTQKCAVCKA